MTRVRRDGPLQWMHFRDHPYWLGMPAARAIFHPNNKIEFRNHPFSQMQCEIYFDIASGNNTYIHLSLGVNEVIFRHPINWGWVLYSAGHFWTSFDMSPYKFNTDPWLEDGAFDSFLLN